MTKILIDEAVVRQALEALETSARNWPSDSVIEAITDLRQALEQPAPAQPDHMEDVLAMVDHFAGGGKPMAEQPAQPWVGLTDEEFVELCSANLGTAALIRAVEAKLKEKDGTYRYRCIKCRECVESYTRAIPEIEAKLKEKNA
jgi:hypothetical protein